MSCNYAEGLSDYEHKGVLGVPEKFDSNDDIELKCKEIVELLKSSQHTVVHTGAGISTSAGIPDFRGPKGVWTLERRGEKPIINISFNDAVPTKTHMAIRALVGAGYIHYIVSQNIDGLHLKSGLSRKHIAELHGNMFIEQCNKCRRMFIRRNAAETVGQKPCGGKCPRACRSGVLIDNILDWEAELPEKDLDMAFMHSTMAELNIALGTSLQIVPSGNLPLKSKKHNGKLVICNLQPTKHDKKADLIINAYVDDVLVKVCKRLGVEIPNYNPAEDPTKRDESAEATEWTMPLECVKDIEKSYNEFTKTASQQRKLGKHKHEFSSKVKPPLKKSKQTKEEPGIKEESDNT